MAEYKCSVPPREPNILNCAIAGMIGAFVSYPIDFIKTHLQTKRIISSVTPQCGSLPIWLKQTYITEGVRRFYRGCLPFTLLVPFERAIKYGSFEYFRSMIMENEEYADLNYLTLSAAVTLGAFFQSLVSTPLELVKIQQQTTGKLTGTCGKVATVPANYLVKRTLALKGAKGMYQGFVPTVARNTCFSWLFFSSVYMINSCGFLKGIQNEHNGKCLGFMTGLVSGSVAAAATSPLDLIKTRTQSIGVPKEIRISHITKEIIHSGGKTALFTGGWTRVVLFLPMYGVAFAVYLLNPDA